MTTKNSFNLAADKVVAMKEWRQKTNALYKAELTTGEKIFLNAVDRPLSVLFGLGLAAKNMFNSKSSTGTYLDEKTFSLYVSGAALNDIIQQGQPLVVNRKFQDKIDDIATRAFDASADVSQQPIMKKLKPL